MYEDMSPQNLKKILTKRSLHFFLPIKELDKIVER